MMKQDKSVVCMLVLGLATSEAWAQHSEHGTLRDVTLEQLGQVDFRVRGESWKLAVDIFNTSMPTASATP